ncbi:MULTISPECIES: transcriptional antiterminator, Rof [unclassified Thioalkalivibrio]|uniref:transcriptional antiterminator, Rof n=1 Tax=unclassified Thioalkalivibrio TaxID=2621013 RepID=UPI0003600D0E|nr:MULTISPECIES: transcriptional antiterminator, Rof [unclassified Thioalkalivibrio]
MSAAPPYTPIACERYSELELAIVRGQFLRTHWRRGAMDRIAIVRPLDLRTRRGAEYLILRDTAGRRQWWRLDRLISFEPVSG